MSYLILVFEMQFLSGDILSLCETCYSIKAFIIIIIKVWYYSHHEWQVPVDLTGDNLTISRRECTKLTTLVKLITKYKPYLQSVLPRLPSLPRFASLHGVMETKSAFLACHLVYNLRHIL